MHEECWKNGGCGPWDNIPESWQDHWRSTVRAGLAIFKHDRGLS